MPGKNKLQHDNMCTVPFQLAQTTWQTRIAILALIAATQTVWRGRCKEERLKEPLLRVMRGLPVPH